MPYTTEYIPTYRRNNRRRSTTPRGKCTIKNSDLRRQLRYNLEDLEKNFITVRNIEASQLIAVLHLNSIVTGYDREHGGRNALLKLRKEAGLESHKEHGKIMFDVQDAIEKLREWMKA